ncbi:hypothetical protein [Amnibacterium endophyticum]|uniref:Uncharacterized protein n=1 Tax=Amnibacterium endophyticum TaxID=2109337 RepID=A0ABW4LGZ6_9MICO
MSVDHFDSRKILANPALTTETVLVGDLAPGDLIYVLDDTSGPEPWRVRYLDRFPGGFVNVHATPGALLHRTTTRSVGTWDGTVQAVKRVVL